MTGEGEHPSILLLRSSGLSWTRRTRLDQTGPDWTRLDQAASSSCTCRADFWISASLVKASPSAMPRTMLIPAAGANPHQRLTGSRAAGTEKVLLTRGGDRRAVFIQNHHRGSQNQLDLWQQHQDGQHVQSVAHRVVPEQKLS